MIKKHFFARNHNVYSVFHICSTLSFLFLFSQNSKMKKQMNSIFFSLNIFFQYFISSFFYFSINIIVNLKFYLFSFTSSRTRFSHLLNYVSSSYYINFHLYVYVFFLQFSFIIIGKKILPLATELW